MKKISDYKYIKNYFDAIDSGNIKVCEDQILLKKYLTERVLNRDDIYINERMVEDSIEVPKKYFPFELFLWQEFAQVFIYGLRWKADDTLVFDTYFVYVGRGSGKNGWISWNSFFLMSKKHGIPEYNIDIYAMGEDQAKTSFKDVYNVLESNPELKSAYTYNLTEIKNKSTQSELHYNTSNARTKDSKRPGMNIFDEVHEYDDYKIIEVAGSGGGKIQDYREFFITTDGNVRGGPLDDQKEEARAILHGELGIDKKGAAFSSMFPFIFRLDDPSEVDDPSNWEKASPSYNLNPALRKKMNTEYSKMQRRPSLRLTFMTKRMNCPMEDTRFAVASYDDVLHTKEKEFPEKMDEVIGTVDFADRRDFASVGLLGKYDKDVYFTQHTFIHESALRLQNIKREVIDISIDQGKSQIVHGKNIEADYIVGWFLEMSNKYYIKKIAMDMYRAKILKPALEEAGFTVEIVRSGSVTHGMLKDLVDDLFINQRLFFGDDAIMRWYCMNVYEEHISNGNIRYEKIEPETRKTDGFFSFLHGLNFLDDIYDSAPVTVTNSSVENTGTGFTPLVF
ncbi:terminase TerL endonuclease subunit [Enterococcus faecium]|uniref:terminase TerL endonuclease subunit n=1 Tax=Enterococcus faecium TaxID=1352 RepID=UPI000BF2097F|nr:terminase TerL endonuclease subunit [Enterococcus faecium]PEH48905.1 terminase [Enterococcus faecium]